MIYNQHFTMAPYSKHMAKTVCVCTVLCMEFIVPLSRLPFVVYFSAELQNGDACIWCYWCDGLLLALFTFIPFIFFIRPFSCCCSYVCWVDCVPFSFYHCFASVCFVLHLLLFSSVVLFWFGLVSFRVSPSTPSSHLVYYWWTMIMSY